MFIHIAFVPFSYQQMGTPFCVMRVTLHELHQDVALAPSRDSEPVVGLTRRFSKWPSNPLAPKSIKLLGDNLIRSEKAIRGIEHRIGLNDKRRRQS